MHLSSFKGMGHASRRQLGLEPFWRLRNICANVQVEQLSRDVHRQQGVTISMASNRGCAPFMYKHTHLGCEPMACMYEAASRDAGGVCVYCYRPAQCCTFNWVCAAVMLAAANPLYTSEFPGCFAGMVWSCCTLWEPQVQGMYICACLRAGD